MYSEIAQSQGGASVDGAGVRVNEFIRFTHGPTMHLLVEHIMRGESCLALTGAQGSGKTVAARLIREELLSRGVNVVSICRRRPDGLSLSSITAQVLNKAEAELEPEDTERLFAVLTGNDSCDRCVLLIDDAETLTDGAQEYLRLVWSITKDAAPQLVFIGKPGQLSGGGSRAAFLRSIVTASWELSPLNPWQARKFVVDALGSEGLSAEATFDDAGLAALVRCGEGRYGRLLAMLSIIRLRLLAEAFRDSSSKGRLTAEAVADVAALLDAERDGPTCVPDASESDAITKTPCDPLPRRPQVAAEQGVMEAPRLRHFSRATLGYGLAGAVVLLVAGSGAAINLAKPDYAQAVLLVGREKIASWLPAASSLFVAARLPLNAVAAAQEASLDRVATGGDHLLSLQVRMPPEQRPPKIVRADALIESSPGAQLQAGAAPHARQVVVAAEKHPHPRVVEVGTTEEVSQAEVSRFIPPPSIGSGHGLNPQSEEGSAAVRPLYPGAHGPSTGVAAKPITATITPEPHAARPTPVATRPLEPVPAASQAPSPPRPILALAATRVPNSNQLRPANSSHDGNNSVAATPAGSVAPDRAEVPTVATLPKPAPGEIALLLSRGDETLKLGDIAAARLLYEQAAEFGVARAALAAGRTYDPEYLASIRSDGVTGDRSAAAKWYRMASDLGDKDAGRLAAAVLAHSGH